LRRSEKIMAWDSTLSFSETVTVNGNSTGLAVGPTGIVEIEIEVSGVSGTSPTLDIKFQDSDDNTTYVDHVIIPQITAAKTAKYYLKTNKKYIRYTKAVTGTSPSFNLEVRVR
jgi:hypothetical protein